MRSLPTDLTAELAKEYKTIVHLVTIVVSASQIYRWTDFDQDVHYAGVWYVTKRLRFDPPQLSITSKLDSVTLEVDNVDKAMSNLILTTDLRGKDCILQRTALDRNLAVIGGVSTLFKGFLDESRANRRRALFKVFNWLIKWRTITPKRIHSPTCPWVFKGTDCHYSGDQTWCDYNWARCKTLLNSINFGGDRWISELIDAEIWWGGKPKVW